MTQKEVVSKVKLAAKEGEAIDPAVLEDALVRAGTVGQELAKKAKGGKKPLWAMTQEEKAEFEAQEADDLINFAEGLDYDKYVNDLEFREGLEAVRDRAGKLHKEQEAFKDQLVKEIN